MRFLNSINLRSYIFLLAALTACVELLMLNRFPFTTYGIESFGRVWQFYISYADVGFVRRALIGTLVSETGVGSLFKNEYVLGIAIHHAFALVLTGIVLNYVVQSQIKDRLLLATAFLSPVFLIQMAYSTATLDQPVLILALINIFFVRNLWLFSFVLILGIVTHELFVFTIPAQFVALILRKNIALNNCRNFLPLMLPAVIALITMLIVMLFGQMDMPQSTYEQMMAEKIPLASNAVYRDFWSGYFEVASGTARNLQTPEAMMKVLGDNLLYIAVPLFYMLLLITRSVMYANGRGLKALVLLACVAPLTTYVIATDFHRWVSMSGNMAIALTLVLAVVQPKATPAWLNWLILSFILFGPFSTLMLDQPFPMYHLLLKKLGWV